jgi:hypothetical protein
MVERVRRGIMRRPLALSLIVLGLVVTLIGGTGLFAPFTDTATTGVNSLTSGTRPKAADIQLAWPVAGPTACASAAYEEDSTTPGHTATDIQPGYSNTQHFCLRNVGSALVGINIMAIDVVDTDVACTGDEAAAGDASCGGDGVGELSGVVFTQVVKFDCDTGQPQLFTGTGTIATMNISNSEWALDPGETLCASVEVIYPPGLPNTVEQQLQAQSDRVTWRYRFTAGT